MEEMLLDALMGGAMSELQGYLQEMVWLVVLLSIPALVYAVAYCFFGIRIYRVLLVINGVLSGGLVGMILLGAVTESVAGAVIGFILVGAIIGVLSWYIYKVFLFIQTFFSGLSITAALIFAITKSPIAALVMGIIVGMALAVLICLYTKLFVMIMTAYNGAGTIASVISLFFMASSAYSVVYLLLLAAFTAAGFYVQNRFFGDSFNAGQAGSVNMGAASCKLVGIEGMYKGFEFDIEDSLTLGRDVDSCNVIFPDTCAGVSRIQCQVLYDRRSKSAAVVDKFSSYGTTLNGARLEINRTMPLKDGDVIMFGENNVFKINC